MQTKITNVSVIAHAIDLLTDNDDFSVEEMTKLTKIKTSYENKNSGEKKPTQTQLDNEKIKNDMVSILNADTTKRFTATDFVKEFGNTYSNQKVSTLLNQLVKEGRANKTSEKGVTYFFA